MNTERIVRKESRVFKKVTFHVDDLVFKKETYAIEHVQVKKMRKLYAGYLRSCQSFEDFRNFICSFETKEQFKVIYDEPKVFYEVKPKNPHCLITPPRLDRSFSHDSRNNLRRSKPYLYNELDMFPNVPGEGEMISLAQPRRSAIMPPEWIDIANGKFKEDRSIRDGYQIDNKRNPFAKLYQKGEMIVLKDNQRLERIPGINNNKIVYIIREDD